MKIELFHRCFDKIDNDFIEILSSKDSEFNFLIILIITMKRLLYVNILKICRFVLE